MNDLSMLDAYGAMTGPDTLQIRRRLPGPIERVWRYLTKSDLRAKWLAAGEMEEREGAPFTLTWRNDALTEPPGARPEGFSEEHSMESRITRLEAPAALEFTWGENGAVLIELEAKGDEVLLTLTHRRLPEGEARQMIRAGWHAHLDVLVARAKGEAPAPFWDEWSRLRKEYEGRE